VAPKREGGTLDDQPRRLTVQLNALASVGGINRVLEIAPTIHVKKTFDNPDRSRFDEFLQLVHSESHFVAGNELKCPAIVQLKRVNRRSQKQVSFRV
jgi:hypothetical protein